jgi:3-hydroxyisobutyrate dehydrogenase
MKVAFAGLGVMGFPMAGHLAKAGHEMSVFNRSPEKAQAWVAKHGGRAGATVAETAKDVEVFILCVGNDDDVRQVVAEALPAMAPGGVVVDHTTTSAVVAREMAELAAKGDRAFVDAPVSGGQAGAENGQLTIMCGGTPEAFAKAEPVIGAYAKATKLMGASGAGQLAKMVNQICIAGIVQGLAEGLHFAKQAGLDPQLVYDAISKGAAQSWQMDNRWKTMTEGKFDFGFAVDWMRKDLGLVLDEARRNGAALDMTAMVDGFYAEVQAMGGQRWDTSSLVARLEKPQEAKA